MRAAAAKMSQLRRVMKYIEVRYIVQTVVSSMDAEEIINN